MPTAEPPIVHFNYDETEACQCRLCTGFRQARLAYETVKEKRGRHHRFCRCEACSAVKERFVDLLAASNQQEIYSELSYILTATPKPHKLAAECLL